MWQLAGKTAIRVAMLQALPTRRVAGCIVARPPAISATPLTYTTSRWRGMYGGMMRSYARVLTKCMIPAKTKNGPKSLLMGRSLWAERGPRLGDAEPLLVQRPADDHALDDLETEPGNCAQILERPNAARVDQLALGCIRDPSQRIEVGPLHQAVYVHRGEDESAQAAPGELGDHLGRAQIGSLCPALGGDLAGARVHRGDDPVAVRCGDRLRHLGIAHRRRAEHDPLCAGGDRLLHLL